MKEFFDTSVLVAAFWGSHPDHLASLDLFASAAKNQSACGIHTVAEVYSAMTSLPVTPAVGPEQALLFVEDLRNRLTLVQLDQEDYYSTIRAAALRGLTGGRIYDALLLRCAAKCGARTIYTWNLRHFRAIAPELAGRIRTP